MAPALQKQTNGDRDEPLMLLLLHAAHAHHGFQVVYYASNLLANKVQHSKACGNVPPNGLRFAPCSAAHASSHSPPLQMHLPRVCIS